MPWPHLRQPLQPPVLQLLPVHPKVIVGRPESLLSGVCGEEGPELLLVDGHLFIGYKPAIASSQLEPKIGSSLAPDSAGSGSEPAIAEPLPSLEEGE